MKKTALVTGSNKGIGFAIVRGLARTGMSVWMGARDRSRGEEAVAILRQEGLDVRLLELDVADEASVQNAAAVLAHELGSLDVLVNNAGILSDTITPPSRCSILFFSSLIF